MRYIYIYCIYIYIYIHIIASLWGTQFSRCKLLYIYNIYIYRVTIKIGVGNGQEKVLFLMLDSSERSKLRSPLADGCPSGMC